MKRYGLIGNPLGHSFSAAYFTEKFDRENIQAVYQNFPISEITCLRQLIDAEDLLGLNVTLPYKQQVIAMLDVLHETAQATQAVNCIQIREQKLIGFNTDIFGFEHSLKSFFPFAKSAKALVFGNGGSSRAVCYVLKKRHIPYQIVSRQSGIDLLAYAQITESQIKAANLLINTTPVGMFPHIENCLPLPYSALTPDHYVFDLIYNPDTSLFLQKAKAAGANIRNGLEMLYLQAEASWQIWQAPKV